MKFEPKTLDFTLSPYTGATRQTWIEAGKYLLENAFRSIRHFDDPVVLPRYEDEITYPNKNTPAWKVQAEYFEGLTRTLFIAGPLMAIEPDLTICGYLLRDYYKAQILRAVTPGDPNYVRTYTEMQAQFGAGDPFATYQQTVETCALVICLEMCHEQIWDTYTKEEKDRIAAFLSDYAGNPTVPQNWRLFNMLDYAFLWKNGYEIDRDIMRDHAQAILGYYSGDGWYRDGRGFDYYSCWAFNLYTPIWNNWYGYENEPYLAQRFEENSNELMKTYTKWFDRDGFTNMWGRSGIYRFAATSPIAGNFMLKNPTADPGLARRIASGSLLQFLTRDDFLYEGVPTLGFYRPFLPLVQGYSCAESPYWMGKAFSCLTLPENHPFWTAKEQNGIWEEIGEKESVITTLDGPGLCMTNHGANGITELRTGKVLAPKNDRHTMWNYSKLAFNTKFPWESASSEEVESQQYVMIDTPTGTTHRCNATFWSGMRDEVVYRRQFFSYDAETEACWLTAMNLADIAVPYGLIRADKLRTCRGPLRLTLGAYGFPDNGTEMEEKQCGDFRAVILKGSDHTGRPIQLAMTIFDGWNELKILHQKDVNPDSENSILVYAETSRSRVYAYEKYFLISQVLTKNSLEDFTEEELFPLTGIEYTDPEACGGYGPVKLVFRDGTVKTVDFDGIEGKLVM
ncbi:MAG: DUF2264 domain-containing protein [Lachnospiraceae bacterium]|nr:DUF2264 domain-containing protein [Lachnospiraceae bacterium]